MSEARTGLNAPSIVSTTPFPMPFMPTSRGFKMAFVNITSLTKYIDELRILMIDKIPDVLAINETHLDSSIPDKTVKIQGYEIIRCDRKRDGGGVALYIRSNINFKDRQDLVNELEAVCVDIHKPNSKPFTIITCYRPPDSIENKVPRDSRNNLFNLMETVLSKIDNEGNDIIWLGDLNCDYRANCPDLNTKILKSLSEVYQLEQLIDDYTHITPTSRSLIDIILCNNSKRIRASGVTNISFNYHSLIYAIRKIALPTNNRQKYVEYRNMKKFNAEMFRDDINQIDWNLIKNEIDPNKMWEKWKLCFLSVCDKHAPIKQRRARNQQSPWITSNIKNMILEKNKLKTTAGKTNNPDIWLKYKEARKTVNNTIKEAKATYYKDHIKTNTGNTREIWRTINNVMNRNDSKVTITELKNSSGTTNDSQKMAEIFNEHFTTVGTTLSSELPESSSSFDDFLQSRGELEFKLNVVSPEDVTQLLSTLKCNKATGLDKISGKFLKEAATSIANPLCSIFNQSIISGIFPDEWKLARVSPIYKKDEKSNPCNYRPISVLPIVAKKF